MSPITKRKFLRYEDVRESGRTNMFDLRNVAALSGLTRDEIIEIQKHYDELCDRYLVATDEN